MIVILILLPRVSCLTLLQKLLRAALRYFLSLLMDDYSNRLFDLITLSKILDAINFVLFALEFDYCSTGRNLVTVRKQHCAAAFYKESLFNFHNQGGGTRTLKAFARAILSRLCIPVPPHPASIREGSGPCHG